MDPHAKTVLQFLRENFNRRLFVDEVAQRAGLTPPQLRELLVQETGEPVFAHLTAIRLSEAARLLVETRLPIADVARQVGINDHPNFVHAFQRRFGMAPRKYRIANQLHARQARASRKRKR